MLFIKVVAAEAEAVRSSLLERGVLDTGTSVQRKAGMVFLPVRERVSGYDVVELLGTSFGRPQSLHDALAGILSAEELAALSGSYDIVGSIAILDIDSSLEPHEQVIAQALFATHKHVKTVLKKAEKHGGEFRTQGLALVAGEDTRETLVTESGCRLLVDVEQVYFSVRLSTERLRIASLVQPGERVLVLFSGAAPYVVVLGKHSSAASVVGVEKNPRGHEYGLENIKRNKVHNAKLFNEDASDLSFLSERFDRIIMPHPSAVLDFLPPALAVAADNATLHIYIFAKEEDIPDLEKHVSDICGAAGFGVNAFRWTKAGHHAPYVYRWCADIVLSSRRAS